MMRPRIEVKAVWNTDLEQLLSSLGLLPQMLSGQLVCAGCGRPLNLGTVGAIVTHKGKAVLVCDNTPCVQTLTGPEVPS